MSISTCFLAIIFFAGCSVCSGNICYLTSCSCDGGMKWTLPKHHTTKCSEIVLGGHSSHCPDRDTVLLFDKPFVTSNLDDTQNMLSTTGPGVLFETTSTENPMLTTIHSCNATEDTWVNSDCSKQCSCYGEQWVCNSTYECSLNATCTVSEGKGQCTCKPCYTGDGETCKPFYKDCQEAYDDGHKQNGTYAICPADWPSTPFNVSCDMTTAGGGWTIFQRRIDRITDFYRNWTSYKHGFGLLENGRDFWLGNEKLFYLTNQGKYKLRVDIVTSSGELKSAEYSTFQIGNESSKYQLTDVEEKPDKTAGSGDGLYNAKSGYFSTYDKDNDECDLVNCAMEHHGAWWYTNDWCVPCWNDESYCDNFETNSTCHNLCTYSNLNGDYKGEAGQIINWYIGRYCKLISSEMKIMPNV